ncbi:MAG: hypothetical protein V1888_03180 [archaeon]
MKKKGISAIVATVLIILITVAAVTIIWAAIIPMIDKLENSGVCLDAVSQLTIENKGYTCRNGADISIQIGHGGVDFDLSDIQILISSEGNTESINLVGASYAVDDLPGINEEKTFIIKDADMITPAGNISQIAIAPIVTIGNTAEICPALNPVVLRDC